MDVGQVGFFSEKQVRKVRVEKRMNEIVNRLNKTKVVKENVDFRSEREERDKLDRDDSKARDRVRKQLEKEALKEKEEAAKLRSYDSVMKQDKMKTNIVSCILING